MSGDGGPTRKQECLSASMEPQPQPQEPQLKYEPLLLEILTGGDCATTLCLSEKMLGVGTKKGRVHVLDYRGNEVGRGAAGGRAGRGAGLNVPLALLVQVRRLEFHTNKVCDISFDDSEEFIASCSEDCSAMVCRQML